MIDNEFGVIVPMEGAICYLTSCNTVIRITATAVKAEFPVLLFK